MNPYAHHTPFADILTITPERAKDILGYNAGNRDLKRRTIDQYSRDLIDGNWAFTGEAIKFSQDGTLLDGQHRIHAVIESGISMRTVVIMGVEVAAQKCMDTGSKRSLSDQLKMRGVSGYSSVAAVTQALYKFTVRNDEHMTTQASIPELMRFYEMHQTSIQESAELARQVSRSISGASIATFGTAHSILTAIDEAETAHFFDRILDRGNGSACPVTALVRTLENAHRNRQTVSRRKMLALVLKCWNAYISGKEVKNYLLFREGGAAPELFPVPLTVDDAQ